MTETRKHNADIDYCPSYKGVWLDRGEIDNISSMHDRFEKEYFRRCHSDRTDDYCFRGKGGFRGDLFDFDHMPTLFGPHPKSRTSKET